MTERRGQPTQSTKTRVFRFRVEGLGDDREKGAAHPEHKDEGFRV